MKNKFKPLTHPYPWNPNNPGKHGKAGTLEKFPKHMPNPPKKLTRNRVREAYDGPIYK